MAISIELESVGTATGIATIAAGGGLPMDGLEILYNFTEGVSGSAYAWQNDRYNRPLVRDSSGNGRHGVILPGSTIYAADYGVRTDPAGTPAANRGFAIKSPLSATAFSDFSLVVVARNRLPEPTTNGRMAYHSASFSCASNGNNNITEALSGQNRTLYNALYLAAISESTFDDPGYSWVSISEDGATTSWNAAASTTSLLNRVNGATKTDWIACVCSFSNTTKTLKIFVAGVEVSITVGNSTTSSTNHITKWLTGVGFHMFGCMPVGQTSPSAVTVQGDVALEALYSRTFTLAEADAVIAAAKANVNARTGMSAVTIL